MTATGHQDAFLPPRLSARCAFSCRNVRQRGRCAESGQSCLSSPTHVIRRWADLRARSLSVLSKSNRILEGVYSKESPSTGINTGRFGYDHVDVVATAHELVVATAALGGIELHLVGASAGLGERGEDERTVAIYPQRGRMRH